MTEKEAIKVLKKNYPKGCKMVDGTLKGGFNDTESEFGQALTLAIGVIKKQTPQKPVKFVDKIYEDTVLICPNCNKVIINVWNKAGYMPNYCHYCGQALDWGDTYYD